MFWLKNNQPQQLKKDVLRRRLTVIIVFILFKVCSPFKTVENTKPSSTPTYSNKYVVNTEVIFAATSETNYNTMMNCIVSGDQQAVGEMVNNGQVKYLYKGNVVYLVTAKFKYFIVRPEGSTEKLYVVGEQLTQN